MNATLSRRRFVATGAHFAAGVATTGALMPGESLAFQDERAPRDLIAGIERSILFNGRAGGTTWFHPRPCMVPTPEGIWALMTLQSISGSDVFGPVHWTISKDMGATWSVPRPIPGLGRRGIGDGWEMGVCDVVPEYHGRAGCVLAIGHNVYYAGGVLARPQRRRWPVYLTWSPEVGWTKPRRLEWDDPRNSSIYTCGCAQRITLDGGDVLVPLSFGPKGREHRSVATIRCTFDRRELGPPKVGNELTNTARRGLLEPSLAFSGGRYYMTIRAEDDRGYVTVSDDGLAWQPQRPWAWDDGQPLVMSTTQQRWLVHSDDLFLVYTRKAKSNVNVFRWRAPLFVARVDRQSLRLVRSSERVVLPLIGDGVNNADHVARMGNFHTVAASETESWVTTGETLPHDGWAGNTLLARIRWRQPNRAALG